MGDVRAMGGVNMSWQRDRRPAEAFWKTGRSKLEEAVQIHLWLKYANHE